MSTAAASDPLACEFPLALKRTYFPMGVPLHIATNSEDLLAAVDPSWANYPELPGARPATLRVMVAERNAAVTLGPSMPAGQEHLIAMVHGPDNFAICDLAASFAFARVTRDVAANSSCVRYHFLDPAAYLMIEASRFCPVHASCVALHGRAVLLCGDSGAGKTTLAYACAKRGWTFLSGDATYIVRGAPGPTVAGRPHSIRFRAEAREIFPELAVYPPERRPGGKMDLEIETNELGLATAFQCKACCVVFLSRRKDNRSATIASFPLAEGIRQLSQVICYGDSRIRAAQTTALLDLMELPVVELTYSDFASAENSLRALTSGSV